MVDTVQQQQPQQQADGASTATTAKGANGVGPKMEDEPQQPTSFASLVGWSVVGIISVVTVPETWQPVGKPTLLHVWYYGWITALSTALGVLPLVFARNFETYWVGVSNAVAFGMMTAASYSLLMEGYTFTEPHDTSEVSSGVRTIVGMILGVVFIFVTKRFLDDHPDLDVAHLSGADARKALLILFVMTLHSFSEGVGIGVSFGGEKGSELGVFISASLAVHNIPEGLAVAVALLPSRITNATAALWCILTSVPQPIMAVPSYLFVHHFIPFLPVGLGFAGGAMAFVAFFELMPEAYEETGFFTTGVISAISLLGMLTIQGTIDEEAR